MREASIQEQPAQEQPSPPREARPRSVLEYRYALYSAAYDARMSCAGANALLGVYARTNRCRRAAEVIALAESQAENGFPKLAVEHLDARQGACPHCVRSSCLSSELFPAA